MQIVYIYDIKTKTKKEFNRVKRRFYYNLNKLNLKNCVWKTKSVLITTPETEGILDVFFKEFKGNIEVYKIHAKLIEDFL